MRAAFLALLLLAVLAPVAVSQTISGTVVGLMGTPLSGIPVAYNLGGNVQQDTTDAAGAYLLSFGTSSVPDNGGPEIQHTTWGKLKAGFKESPAAVGKAAGPRTDTSPDTLYFDGGNSHWSVRHFIGTWEGTYPFNVALCPKVWTVPPYFESVDMDVATIKNALFVCEGCYLDNLHWASGAYPIPADGESWDHSQQMTQAMGDSVNVWSQEFAQRAGIPAPYEYLDGGVVRDVSGAWVVFNDTNSFTEVLYTYDPPIYELFAVTLHIRTSRWIRAEVEHEMFRGIGLSGPSFDDPRYGTARLHPTLFNQYDAALVRFIYEKQRRNEEGKNQARLIEAYE